LSHLREPENFVRKTPLGTLPLIRFVVFNAVMQEEQFFLVLFLSTKKLPHLLEIGPGRNLKMVPGLLREEKYFLLMQFFSEICLNYTVEVD
jgi:hypothetical protein